MVLVFVVSEFVYIYRYFSFKVEMDSNYVIDRFCYLVWVIFLDFWMLLDNCFCLYIIVYWNKMVDGVDDLGLK